MECVTWFCSPVSSAVFLCSFLPLVLHYISPEKNECVDIVIRYLCACILLFFSVSVDFFLKVHTCYLRILWEKSRVSVVLLKFHLRTGKVLERLYHYFNEIVKASQAACIVDMTCTCHEGIPRK